MNFVNVPTCLTVTRVIMVPLFTAVFYLPVFWGPMLCTIIFFIAAVTDWFDGYLARRWQQTSKFGKFLDPVADKIMIITALVLISEHFHVWWITLPSSSMIVREIVISALREWVSVSSVNNCNSITVLRISKIKTCTQMVTGIMLLSKADDWIVVTLGVVSLYISFLLTLGSMCIYLFKYRSLYVMK